MSLLRRLAGKDSQLLFSFCGAECLGNTQLVEHQLKCPTCFSQVREFQAVVEQVIIQARKDVLDKLQVAQPGKIAAQMPKCKHCELAVLGGVTVCASCCHFYKVRYDGTPQTG